MITFMCVTKPFEAYYTCRLMDVCETPSDLGRMGETR